MDSHFSCFTCTIDVIFSLNMYRNQIEQCLLAWGRLGYHPLLVQGAKQIVLQVQFYLNSYKNGCYWSVKLQLLTNDMQYF